MDDGHSLSRSLRKRASASRKLARPRSIALATVALATSAFAAPAMAATETETFNYTGAAQAWTVPPGVTEATFDLYGAQGGGTAAFPFAPGLGGRATATIALTPGASIQINVGGQGGPFGSGVGGFNGGGSGGFGGGGASDIRVGGTTLADRALVAGGGGGAGSIACNGQSVNGGGGGGAMGGAGAASPGGLCAGAVAGGGGTQTEGGTATAPATSGGFGAGGAGGGGGGGGGWFGGGGGRIGAAGGGGGSGLGPAGTVFATGVRNGDGLATVSYELDPAPVTTISSGPDGLTNDASPSFAFASDQRGSTFECSLDGAAFSSCASPQGYAGLADGQHSFAVRATNAQLTTEQNPATRQFTVDTSASGSVSAKKNQRQSKGKIVVKVKVSAANEPLTTKAKGKINVGRKGFKLAPQTTQLSPGQTQALKLKPRKDQDRILRALAEGTSVKAKLQVRFTDPVGNTALDKPRVKLTG